MLPAIRPTESLMLMYVTHIFIGIVNLLLKKVSSGVNTLAELGSVGANYSTGYKSCRTN